MSGRKTVTSLQVVEYLRNCIEHGDLQPEDKLPSERVISEQLQTTRVTAREALKQLEAEGAIYRSNRRGWFVTPRRINYDPSRNTFFMDYVAAQGFTPYSTELGKERIEITSRLARKMDAASDETVVKLERVRGANGRAVYLETIYLRESLLPGIFDKALERSVSTVLTRDYEQEFSTVELDITVGALTAEQAALLDAPAGYTCICVHRITRNANGDVLEYDREFWRHDSLNLNVLIDNRKG